MATHLKILVCFLYSKAALAEPEVGAGVPGKSHIVAGFLENTGKTPSNCNCGDVLRTEGTYCTL